MNIIFIIICTIIFYNIIYPMLDNVGALIQSIINKKIRTMQLELSLSEAKINKEIENLIPNIINNNNNVQAIGFNVTEAEEEYCEECDKKKN